MARWYASERIQEILHSLGIKSVKGKVTGEEAAAILTWRAKEEQEVEHKYKSSILRRHVEQGNIKAYPGTKLTKEGESRKSLYDVEAIFDLTIAPRRGLARKQDNDKVVA